MASMSSRELADRFALAIAHHQAGRLAEAESLYRQICAADPRHFDALHYLGVLAGQMGRNDIAIDLIGRATALKPDYVEAQFNLGNILAQANRLDHAATCFARVVALRPQSAEAHHSLGLALMRQGMCAKAIDSFARALALKPDFVDACINQGIALAKEKRLDEAAARFRQALGLRPNSAELHSSLGSVLLEQGDLAAATPCLERALAISPDLVDTLYNHGLVLARQERFDEAAIRFRRALTLRPDDPRVCNDLGAALSNSGKPSEAMPFFERALALKPDFAGAHFNIGSTLERQGNLTDAAARFERARLLDPGHAQTHAHLGSILMRLGKLDEAMTSLERALALKSDLADALNCRGLLYHDRRQFAEALADYDAALAIAPDNTDALNNRGNVLHSLDRVGEALECYERAIAIDPTDGKAFYNKGNALRALHRTPEALASYEQALAADPDHPYAFSAFADAARSICDWDRTTAAASELDTRVRERKSVVFPFTVLGYSGDPALQLDCAKRFLQDRLPVPPQALGKNEIREHGKLRIAYLSSDFRRHVVAVAMAELFELHDRTRFEILGVSLGPDDRSDIRTRLIRAFDEFHDVQSRSDREIAQLIIDRQVDIAVDLNGHTEGSRPGILAYRPAPVQATYVGYAGTTGADFIDYVIADKVVLPFDQQPFYAERIVRLPDCYLPNDSTQGVAARAPSRTEAGLPEEGFVFCCFNNSYKIMPSVFEAWMRLLKAVQGSVLWLSQTTGEAMANLRGQASAHGIDPGRLVFAQKLQSLEDHLVRHRLADLFLDTAPYNAHSTATDALRAGLPLITWTGTSFAGRVATSILRSAGIPELAAASLAEYEALALELATDPSMLRSFRQRLLQNQPSCPLFDTRRLCRHLESAYTTMWTLLMREEGPQSFSVEPLPAPN
jgi:protein O-GlcNAc transferase